MCPKGVRVDCGPCGRLTPTFMIRCGVRVFRTVVLALFALAPVGVFAQSGDTGAPPTTVRLRFGPLSLNPTIGLTGAGVDDNVFNDPDQVAKSDYTATLTPATDLWLRFGRSWINA